MLRADEGTLQRVREVLAAAMDRGADPAELLDRAGLLWHPGRQNLLSADLLGDAAERVDYASVRQLLADGERMPVTALDTKRVVAGWLRRQGETFRK